MQYFLNELLINLWISVLWLSGFGVYWGGAFIDTAKYGYDFRSRPSIQEDFVISFTDQINQRCSCSVLLFYGLLMLMLRTHFKQFQCSATYGWIKEE